jgi:ribonuclease E
MTKRMLIDATHAEETRVVVLDGNRLEDFDVETSSKRQLKGNIYLAKVVRVEPSLQAAFVEYGGNRHGFLAFGEIHPDYYQIPVADRQRLIEMQAEEARREEEAEDRAAEADGRRAELPKTAVIPAEVPIADEPDADGPQDAVGPVIEPAFEGPSSFDDAAGSGDNRPAAPAAIVGERIAVPFDGDAAAESAAWEPQLGVEPLVVEPSWELSGDVPAEDSSGGEPAEEPPADPAPAVADTVGETVAAADAPTETDVIEASGAGHEADSAPEPIPEQPPPETVGGDGDGGEEARDRRVQSRFLRNYKIQEVIRRRQILLVQVVKEERGTKGAALTTYLSLAGRFCVLMPNSPRGGGISRKITSATDRRRLKDIIAELDMPQGMGLIVRTAGANRPKPEIRRDCEYLLRLWDDIREHTLKSVAPALIYEEASLIKRAIRDVYSRDIDEIQVDGEEGWRAAHEFMRMLMPSHAKKVQLWRDPAVANGGGQPLFAKYTVEAQLDAMLQPIVQLRSGGYLVINQTEALVAIDVNSGRSTRERGIEETAVRTNLEAADEAARQLRLRDLAGLIVIDFIDMESKKHNAQVERRLKEGLKSDRARIQVGHISHFGLMEMSRQRLRPSLAEASFIACPHCGGTGHVRSTESAAIHVLRGVEEEGARRRAAEIVVYASVPVALYILNHKRERLGEIEARYGMHVVCLGDETQMASQYRIDRVKPQVAGDTATFVTQDTHPSAVPAAVPDVEEAETEEPEVFVAGDAVEAATETADVASEAATAEAGETAEEAERHHRRRRRRRRAGTREDTAAPAATEPVVPGEAVAAEIDTAVAAEMHIEGVPEHVEAAAEEEPRARRRGRRGGRRRRQDGVDGEVPSHAEPGADQPDLPPIYTGPTPANPFGGHAFDIFDVLDQAEPAAANAASVVEVAEPVAEPVSESAAPVMADADPQAGVEQVLADAPPTPEPPTPDAVSNTEPEPATALEPMFVPALAEPVMETAASNTNEPEPAVRPILIGESDAPIAQKKRGWWRR